MLCIVYVSEAARTDVISHLRTTAVTNGGKLAHSFADPVYGRTSYFLTGTDLAGRALALCNEAFKLIDYRTTQGTHPALGSVDHVCFQPLGSQTTLADTAKVALDFSARLYDAHRVPVFNYGESSPEKTPLKDIRKQLGYFEKSSISAGLSSEERVARFVDRIREGCREDSRVDEEAGRGEEGIEGKRADVVSPLRPSFGTIHDLDATKGVTLVGAVPFVQNLNMRFRPQDPRPSVIKITAAVRERYVEALTLTHAGGAYEVACNLKLPAVVTPLMVLDRARRCIVEEGLDVDIVESYTTGPTEAELLLMCE
jgi:hypothetical protein